MNKQPNKDTGPALLRAVEEFFTRYAALPSGMPLVVALYTAMTHCFEVFDTLPYLTLGSPTKGCGKTRVLELLSFVCASAVSTVGITAPALYRTIQKDKPTLLIDESEALSARTEKAEALREIANAGYKKGQRVRRCEGGKGGKYKLVEFDVFGPKVFGLIGKLPATLADRSIEVRMQRSRQRLTRYRRVMVEPEGHGLRERLSAWIQLHKGEVKEWYESHDIEFLEGRNEELWLPLFSMCAVIAPDRLPELEAIARQHTGAKHDDEADETNIRLLSDIRAVFERNGADRLATEAILFSLNNEFPESPWASWSRGQELNDRGLARLLAPFGIRSQNMRLDSGKVAKGYYRDGFSDAWARYLPNIPPASRYNATERINIGRNGDLPTATETACRFSLGCQSLLRSSDSGVKL